MENTLIKALRQVIAKYEDWSGIWVHYTDINKLGVNPKQFHQDPAGIYLFPEEFKTKGSLWQKKKFVFTLEIKPNAKILDLGALSEKEKLDLAGKLEVPLEEDFFKRKYVGNRSWWESLKNKYILQINAPGAAKWTKDFRKLGYDAIFDDKKTIHVAEVQLLVFNPKILKVIKVVERSGSGGIHKKIKDHQKLVAEYSKPYGEIEIKPVRTKRGWGNDPNYLVGELKFTKGDAYIYWGISCQNGHWMSLSVLYASEKPSGYSLGSLVKPYDKKDIERAVKRAIEYVLGENGDV